MYYVFVSDVIFQDIITPQITGQFLNGLLDVPREVLDLLLFSQVNMTKVCEVDFT